MLLFKVNYCVLLSYIFCFLSIYSCVRIEVTEESNIEEDLPPEKYIPTNLNAQKDGLLGQGIYIKGQDFFLDSLSFYFDTTPAFGALKNEDTLIVTVPRELSEVESVFSIRTRSKDSLLYSSSFKLRKPFISHFSKSDITFGEWVWIYGKNFDSNRDYISVYLNDNKTFPSRFHYDSLEIQIPNNLNKQELSVKIQSQLQETTNISVLKLKEPKINSFSSEVFVGSIEVLKGEYFNPDSNYSKILINDEIETYIYSNDRNGTLKLRVPYGPYKDFVINSITYETAGMKIRQPINTKIASNHILYSKNAPFLFSSSRVFEFNENLYALGIELFPDSNPDFSPYSYLWRFNMETQLWIKDERIKIETNGLIITQIENGVLYVYRSGYDDCLFKVDLNDFTLVNLSVPVDDKRKSPSLFLHEGYLYFGKGASNETVGVYYKDLFRMSVNGTNSNQWEEVSTDDIMFHNSRSFVYNGEVYLSTYVIKTFLHHTLYKFNSTRSSFETVINFDKTPNYVFIDNEVYVILSNSNAENLKKVYKLPSLDILNPIFTFTFDGLHNVGDKSYFSFKNKAFFEGGLNNSIYPTEGIYKLSDELNNKFK